LLRAEQTQGFPAVVFVHRSTREAAEPFFAKRAPTSRAIADPAGTVFKEFALEQGSLLQILGPTAWWRGLRALLRGNSVGIPAGNERQMPGAFLVQGRKVLWAYRARHSADHPDLSAMMLAMPVP
tara:strand:- start:17 stop:391 length:375 start_codon:yes stop_codon:yes gene_type:complete